MVKNVGIVSLYYKNRNYGGLLQAYALTMYLNNQGFEAEQICVIKQTVSNESTRSLRDFVKRIIENGVSKKLQLRNSAFQEFENKIPHSNRVYSNNTIAECNELYDAFIAGSDQIWNMSWYQPEYFLDFVSQNKLRCSYSASMPDVSLSTEQEKIVFDHLSKFDCIAVREKNTFEKLKSMNLGIDIRQTIDPTMLLDCAEWENFAEDIRGLSEDYVFCYFLSGKKVLRDAAEWFANKRKLKIVTLPHLNSINIPDVLFGDIKLYNISPEELLGLIKNAKYILTDSFHVAVFSNIFRKKYIAFSRAENRKMDSRIMDLLYLWNEPLRFCDSATNNYCLFNSVIDNTLNKPIQEYDEIVAYSKKYLLSILYGGKNS